jgi:hypothetical protein
MAYLARAGYNAAMKHASVIVAVVATALTALGSAARPALAETVVYQYPALPGPVATCQWFDDSQNDRSIDAIIRQTDLIYNRKALPPGASVTVTQTGTTAAGGPLVGFDLSGRRLCAGAQALHPELSEPTPTLPQ